MNILALLISISFSLSSFAFCDLKISKAALAIAKINSEGELDITNSLIVINSVSTFTFSDKTEGGESTMDIEVTSEGSQNACIIRKIEITQFAG